MESERIDKESLTVARNKVVVQALRQCRHNRTKAALLLGISLRTIGNYILDIRRSGQFIGYGTPGKPRGEFSKRDSELKQYEKMGKNEVVGMATNKERINQADNPDQTFKKEKDI